MTTWIFVDLDDTFMQTKRKCPPEGPLFTAALDRHGNDCNFQTMEQLMFWQHLNAMGTVVPVTLRDRVRTIDRMKLNFSSYKIINSGATLLDANNQIDAAWQDHIGKEQEEWAAKLHQVLASFEKELKHLEADCRLELVHDFGMPLYITMRGDDASDVDAVARHLFHNFWPINSGLHINGRGASFLPPCVRKERATQFLMDNIQQQSRQTPLFIGAGDSLTDLPFMQLCHYTIVPPKSQIMEHIQ